MKILVVHRQKMILDQIKTAINDATSVVVVTQSGLDGLLISRIELFDLIICGTDLPVITGFELVRSIRNYSVNKRAAVVLISETVDAKTEHLGNALGVASVITTADIELKLPAVISGTAMKGLQLTRVLSKVSNYN